MKRIEQRCVLIGVDFSNNNKLPVELSLEELEQLANTAGAVVIDKYIQRRDRPHPAYFVGKGFIERIASEIGDKDVNLLIFDDELSGSQLRNVEEITNLPVIDRTALILDIFAKRARSRAGKLQVELAQLEYRLPRLAGIGGELSRLAGGIGTRGPGETKLETDRRHIQRRIDHIKKELHELRKHREEQRKKRRNKLPVVALVGYTNAGKSTLRYKFLQEYAATKVYFENEDGGTNKLFATLDPTLRSIKTPSGREILISDTVGFIQKLPHQLISAFKATLEEVLEADLLLHVVDSSSSYYEYQMQAVKNVLAEIGAKKIPRITVYNKIDLISRETILLPAEDSCRVEVSAITGEGIKDLIMKIEEIINSNLESYEIAVPYDMIDYLAILYKVSLVKDVKYQQTQVVVKGKILPENKHYVQKFS